MTDQHYNNYDDGREIISDGLVGLLQAAFSGGIVGCVIGAAGMAILLGWGVS